VTPMKLNGPQTKQFSEALRDAFTESSLGRMLLFELDKELRDITTANNFTDVVVDLIRAANREGWVEQLIAAARSANPGNQALRAFAEQVQRGVNPPPATPPPSRAPTPEDEDTAEQARLLQEALRAKKRRLGVLEITAARYGFNVPAEVALEIEDLKREIPKLEQELKNLTGTR